MIDYKYDIAISLCKEDANYARDLKGKLNEKLRVFIYEDEQARLTGKSGISEFTSIFRSEARLIIILGRSKYGEEGYTKLEQDAIHDRLVDEKMDMAFIVVVQMESLGKPSWYPSSRIYASAYRQTIEEVAAIIEYKLIERGGEIEPLTFEDKIELKKKNEAKQLKQIRYLQSPESNEPSHKELFRFEELVNQKIDFVQENRPNPSFGRMPFRTRPSRTRQSAGSWLQLSNYRLHINISYPSVYNAPGSQAFTVELAITSEQNSIDLMVRRREYTEDDILAREAYRFNLEDSRIGWSEVSLVEGERAKRNSVFRFEHERPYILGKIISTEKLIDQWFQELLDLAIQEDDF